MSHRTYIHGIHMGCEQIYGNIAHQQKKVEMKTRWSWVCHMFKFMYSILQIRAWGMADTTFVCKFSPHTVELLNKLEVTEVTTANICLANSSKMIASEVTDTASLMYPHRKTFKGVRLNKWDGQLTGLLLPIHFPGKWWFRKPFTSWWKCGGTPSCWNSTSSGTSSCKIGMKYHSNTSR